MALRSIGTLIQADADGVLPRIGRAPHGDWADVLNDLSEQTLDTHGHGGALVLRGSVARGAPMAEAADLDVVVFADETPDVPLVCDLPLGVTHIPVAHFEEPRWVWMRFMLAHNGYTVAGPDYLDTLPPPRLGPQAIAHLRNADNWLQAWPGYWETEEPMVICTWLMKRIVRSLFESQMMRLNAFSRDIYPCMEVACDAFPARRSEIRDAAELAVCPTASRPAIKRVVERLRPVLLAEQVKLRAGL